MILTLQEAETRIRKLDERVSAIEGRSIQSADDRTEQARRRVTEVDENIAAMEKLDKRVTAVERMPIDTAHEQIESVHRRITSIDQEADLQLGTLKNRISAIAERIDEVGRELDRQVENIGNRFENIISPEQNVMQARLTMLETRVGLPSPDSVSDQFASTDTRSDDAVNQVEAPPNPKTSTQYVEQCKQSLRDCERTETAIQAIDEKIKDLHHEEKENLNADMDAFERVIKIARNHLHDDIIKHA